MQRNEIFIKLEEIFRDLFEEEDLIITESTSSDDIEDWDSLNNINLVSSIEQEFKLRFALNEISSLQNVGGIIDTISKKIQ